MLRAALLPTRQSQWCMSVGLGSGTGERTCWHISCCMARWDKMGAGPCTAMLTLFRCAAERSLCVNHLTMTQHSRYCASSTSPLARVFAGCCAFIGISSTRGLTKPSLLHSVHLYILLACIYHVHTCPSRTGYLVRCASISTHGGAAWAQRCGAPALD